MLSTLIDFLMNLMRDEDAAKAFNQDPAGTLSKGGLDGISGQDVRDARLIMADDGGIHPRGDHHGSGGHHTSGGHHRSYSGDDDPVREINHTTKNYTIDQSHHYTFGDVDQTFNLINIDDHDTTVVDSFNSADSTDVVAIQDNSRTLNVDDSFNKETNESTGTDPDPANSGPKDAPTGEEPDPHTDPVHSGPEDPPFTEEPDPHTDPVDSGPEDPLFTEEPDAHTDPVDSDPVGGEPDLETAVM